MTKAGLLLSAALLLGCANSKRDFLTADGTISGRVIKGPVGKATVIAAHVLTGVEYGRATTDDDGSFAVGIGAEAGPIRVCASGGTYTEEATGTPVGVGTAKICTVVPEFAPRSEATTVITPWTHLAVARADSQVVLRGIPYVEAWAEAYAAVAALLSCDGDAGDVLGAIPEDATTEREGAADITPALVAGIYNAGLSQQARLMSERLGLTPGTSVTAVTVMQAFALDLTDGVFDGDDRYDPVLIASIPLDANSIRGAELGLAQGVRAFLQSDKNRTGLTPTDLQTLLVCLSNAGGTLFTDNPTGVLDLEGPRLTFLTPAAGANISGTAAISLSAVDDSTIDEVWLQAAPGLVPMAPVITGNTASLVGELRTVDVQDGAYTITAFARDTLGNESSASIAVQINNAAPLVVFTSPSASASVSGLVNIVATASDPQGVLELVSITPAGLVDIDSDPARFAAAWDTTLLLDGPTVITLSARDNEDNDASTSLSVLIDNNAPGLARGQVYLDSPVANVRVQAFEATAAGPGQVLATANTQDGAFELLLPDSYSGPLLLRASGAGATYRDAATDTVLTFGATDELLLLTNYVPSPAGTALESLSINAVTTLAAHLALQFAASGESLEQATTRAHTLWNEHLQRPDAFDVRTTPVSNFNEDPVADDVDAQKLGLWHASLSRLGAQLATESGQAKTFLTTLKLLPLLRRDLDDGVLDGRKSTEAIALTAQASLTTNTLRSRHAISMIAWLNRDALADGSLGNNNSSLLAAHFGTPGGLYDDVATNTSALFSPEPIESFDLVGPTITLVEPVISAAKGVIAIRATATDPSGVQAMLAYVDGRPHAALGPDQDPLPGAYQTTLNTAALTDGPHTVSVVALDLAGNAALVAKTLLIDNSAPNLTFANIPALTISNITLSGTVDDTHAGSRLTYSLNGGSPVAIAEPATNTYSLSVALPCNQVVTIKVVATNATGLTKELTRTTSCDNRAPSFALEYSPFKQADQATVSAASGQLVYDYSSVQAVELNTLQWEQENPPVLHHWFNRFDYLPAQGLNEATQGFPTLVMAVSDAASPDTAVSTPTASLVVDYQYWVGTQLLRDWRTAPHEADAKRRLRFSYQTLGIALQDRAPDPKPIHRVVLRVRDAAGNVATQNFYFRVHAEVPPMYLTDCGIHSYFNNLDMTATDLDEDLVNFFNMPNAPMYQGRLVFARVPENSASTWRYRVTIPAMTTQWTETMRRQLYHDYATENLSVAEWRAPLHGTCSEYCSVGSRYYLQQWPWEMNSVDNHACKQGSWPGQHQQPPYVSPPRGGNVVAHPAPGFFNEVGNNTWDVLDIETDSTPIQYQADAYIFDVGVPRAFTEGMQRYFFAREYEARSLTWHCSTGTGWWTETRRNVTEYVAAWEVMLPAPSVPTWFVPSPELAEPIEGDAQAVGACQHPLNPKRFSE